MPRKKIKSWQRAFFLGWHLARGLLVRSGGSKVYHLAKAAYQGYKLFGPASSAREEAKKLGLSNKEFGVLLMLASGGSFTVKQIAEKLEASEGTVRKHLNTFVKAGIAEKDTSARPYIYRLKDKYKEMLEEELVE